MSKVTTNTLSGTNERNQTEQGENGTSSHLRSVNLSPSQYSNKPKSSTSSVSDGKKKMGHREVKDGVVHYKKVPTDELKKSIQFGIVHTISFSHNYPDRDILIQDFTEAETIQFPKAGTSETPPHDFSDFRLKVYAPYGFKYLRGKCNLDEIDFMSSIGDTELKEISNPGASGSVFYKTSNDKYILKTVQYQEAEFLKTFLGGYTVVSASYF